MAISQLWVMFFELPISEKKLREKGNYCHHSLLRKPNGISNGTSAGKAGTSAYMALDANALKGGGGSQHFHLIQVGRVFFLFIWNNWASLKLAKAAQQVYHFYEQAPGGATLVPCSLPSPSGAALKPRPALLPVRCCNGMWERPSLEEEMLLLGECSEKRGYNPHRHNRQRKSSEGILPKSSQAEKETWEIGTFRPVGSC